MESTYQRRILVRRDLESIAADLEDNFHRFGVRLALAGSRIASAEGVATRVPWATCPGALAGLRDFEGHDVRQRFEIDRGSKTSRHCTHLFDITMLALDHLRLNIPDRDYGLSVWGPRERELVQLSIDGSPARGWVLTDGRFATPHRWHGHEVRNLQTLADMDCDKIARVEHMLMRRALHIGRGRFLEQDLWKTAADLNAEPSCISFHATVRDHALKIRGTAVDFTGVEHRLLAALRG